MASTLLRPATLPRSACARGLGTTHIRRITAVGPLAREHIAFLDIAGRRRQR